MISKDIARLIGADTGEEDAFFRFIEDNASVSPDTLRLRYRGASRGFDINFAIDQIDCRRRTRTKLPLFNSNMKTLYPATVSAEQSSDEGIAAFHSRLVAGEERVADLTAGLGIDALALSLSCGKVTAVEIEALRSHLLAYNAVLFGRENLEAVNADCLQWLPEAGHFDTIFIDPARRGEMNSRKYRFADCAPDITANLDLLLSHCHRLLVKASPLLDPSAIREELPGVTEMWVLSRKGECKEILIEVRNEGEFSGVTAVEVDSNGNGEAFQVEASHLGNEGVRYAEELPAEGGWLYEASSSVMKLGAWGEICRRWSSLTKAGGNSHLFFSAQRIEGFPGRELEIERIVDKKILKSLKGKKINVVARNYPLTPEQIRKKAVVSDGGDSFLIGTRWGRAEKPILILAHRPN